ncbi:MAG: RNA polymerase sigma-70 factor, partial [Chitinophagaceae bacterium]|nr:RNA polymerase sigma-70 factor [Chitinophagaceae bacterium]
MQQVPQFDIKILLTRIVEGDENAFRMLFEHYKERFYTAAFKMIRSADQAEEIVEEVFVSIWIKREQIALAEKPENYLFTILQNTVYAAFRKTVQERRHKLRISDEREKTVDSVENQLIEKEKTAIIESVISRLPTQQKTIYRLAKQDGMSREEIAKQLNISPNTVRNHLAAAVDSLRTWAKTNESALGWI